MSETIHDRIERELAALRPPPRDHRVGQALLAEARHVAHFAENHHAPSMLGGNRLPGLSGAKLSPTVAAEIRFLVDALESSNVTNYAASPPAAFPLRHVRAVVVELRRALRWLAGEDAALAETVRNLVRAHRRARGAAAWAGALGEHLRLARAEEARLRELPVFDAGLFVEAEALLRAHRETPPDDAAARVRRAGFAALLRERIRRVVAAADFAFHAHPDIAREARSPELRRRAAAAARARREGRAAVTPTPDVPAEDPTT